MEENLQITRRYFQLVLRQFRHRAGLTQEQVAEKIGVSVTYVGLMETGKKWPNVDMIFKLAKALGVRPVELIQALDDEAEKSR